MNVVDSSGWLEYFAGSENAHFFAPAIKATDTLVVPTICMYEVFKRLLVLRRDQHDHDHDRHGEQGAGRALQQVFMPIVTK